MPSSSTFSSEEAVQAALTGTIAAFRRVDCMFAKAGISGRVPARTEMSSTAFRELLAVSLDGAFYTLRAGARHMKERAGAGDPGGSLAACHSLSIYYGVSGMQRYAAA